MSDEQIPAWAHHIIAQIKDTEGRLTTKIDGGEHAMIEEVGKAISDSETRLAQRIDELRADMTRRFDQVHDDLTVNLARADVAIERVQRIESELRKELSQLQRRLRDLEHWREHRPGAGA